MPPFLCWPDHPWRVIYAGSAFDHGVSQEHIEYLISLPAPEVFLHGGRPSHHDMRYSGGIRVARATMARGLLPDGRPLEVGLRQDFRQSGEVCRVFHAMYR